MNALDLKRVGRMLYGEHWQSALAHDLGVADRTVRRWLAGASAVPSSAERRLRHVLEKRRDEMDEALDVAAERPGRRDAVSLHGFMRGSVTVPPGFDLTEPVLGKRFDAADGILYR